MLVVEVYNAMQVNNDRHLFTRIKPNMIAVFNSECVNVCLQERETEISKAAARFTKAQLHRKME